MIADDFIQFSPELRKLPSALRREIHELVFCQRQDTLSVVIGLYDFNAFAKIAKKVPDEVNRDSKRFGIDLSSIYSDKLRLYWADREDPTVGLYGAYVSFANEITEKKTYRRVEGGLSIERVINGIPSEEAEGEVECSINDWTGPIEIVEHARLLNINTMCLKKTHTNQTYLRIARD